MGEADNGVTALEQISSRKLDLVLLDLQMPEMGGFEVIHQIHRGPNMPVIVIVTAYDQHALEAFETGAIDYLLKPVGQNRLVRMVERAMRITGREAEERLAHLQALADPMLVGQRPKKIVGRVGAEYFLLSVEEIYSLQAEGDIVWICTARKRYLATETLKGIEERLRHSNFQRIHRNALVNVDHVRKMSALSSQRWLITLSNDQELIASKRQARSIRGLLNE